MNPDPAVAGDPGTLPAGETKRLRSLQQLGTLCGFSAGVWLGAAEAPTKLVTAGISPMVISFMMVLGVFLARWTVPALVQGTSYVRVDLRKAPHLVIWAILAGCIWAVANTLTIFAIRNIGLSIAFPLWNSNSLIGIFWAVLLFGELGGASRLRWLGVLGGALLMFGGAVLLAIASSSQAAPGKVWPGVAAALGAGMLWGTMYIPYRKAYLTGMNPLSFVTLFTIGELGMMSTLAVTYSGGVHPFWQQLANSRGVLFWMLLGGFIWVIGDLLQQYAAKYIGISRGIPLSNTNQLWGLLWGVLVFGELGGAGHAVYLEVIAGSVIMALGAGAIALSSASEQEHVHWKKAAERESFRYGLDQEFVLARLSGKELLQRGRLTWVDWLLVIIAVATIAALARVATLPGTVPAGWALAGLAATMVIMLAACGIFLWKRTRFC